MTNKLYYSDNLQVLRDEIEIVDVIHLEPPFNSTATYNLLLRSPPREAAESQIEAFGDSSDWNDHAEDPFDQMNETAIRRPKREGESKQGSLL